MKNLIPKLNKLGDSGFGFGHGDLHGGHHGAFYSRIIKWFLGNLIDFCHTVVSKFKKKPKLSAQNIKIAVILIQQTRRDEREIRMRETRTRYDSFIDVIQTQCKKPLK